MDTATPLSRQVLDEDLQIIRVTLATIADDIRLISPKAAEAVQTALTQLDQARQAFTAQAPHQPQTGPSETTGPSLSDSQPPGSASW